MHCIPLKVAQSGQQILLKEIENEAWVFPIQDATTKLHIFQNDDDEYITRILS